MLLSGKRTIVFFTKLSALPLILAWLPAQAQAANYCWFSSGTLHHGQTATVQLKIVVSSVKRIPIPGRTGERLWCTQNRSSLGGHSSKKIVEGPKLGEVTANGYRISYKGNRIGKDRFVIQRSWMHGSANNLQTGTLIYDVDVVAAPF